MAASYEDIKGWFDRGVEVGARYMIVVCDTFDHEDYPVLVGPEKDFWVEHDKYNGRDMQRVMEVYDLHMDRDTQLAEGRAHHEPPRT